MGGGFHSRHQRTPPPKKKKERGEARCPLGGNLCWSLPFQTLPLGSRTASLSAVKRRRREEGRASGPTRSSSLLFLREEALDTPEKKKEKQKSSLFIYLFIYFLPSPGVGSTSKGPARSSSIQGFFFLLLFFSTPNYRFERCCFWQLRFFLFLFFFRKQSIAPLMEIASFRRRLR